MDAILRGAWALAMLSRNSAPDGVGVDAASACAAAVRAMHVTPDGRMKLPWRMKARFENPESAAAFAAIFGGIATGDFVEINR